MMDEQDETTTQKLKRLATFAKQVVGMEDAPEADQVKSRADSISHGLKKFKELGGLSGKTSAVRAENVRTLRSKGMSERDAIKASSFGDTVRKGAKNLKKAVFGEDEE
jgi:hypothetical protein